MSEIFEFEYKVLQEMLIVNHQDGFSYNMCYADDVYSVASKLNEQQSTIEHKDIQIQYWRDKCNSLLWILSQFDNAKVKELLEEIESDGFDLRNRILEYHIKEVFDDD